MATMTVSPPKPGPPGKPVKVFSSKRARKAYRKNIIRNVVANKRADWQIRRESKREFYRRLRLMKLNRLRVASEMEDLAGELNHLRRQVVRVEDRRPAVDPRIVAVAVASIASAERAVDGLAANYRAFAKRRILHEAR